MKMAVGDYATIRRGADDSLAPTFIGQQGIIREIVERHGFRYDLQLEDGSYVRLRADEVDPCEG